ncbi:MAG: hypothetical protein HY606_12990 [Planctomycetes bacterium]|nr:hypothetical protein [Planctomycetota bacterium]
MMSRLIKIVLVLVILDICLTLGISIRNMYKQKVVVVPGAKTEQILLPDAVAAEQIISFGLLYLNTIENFNPETLEDNITFILSKISPDFYPKMKSIYKKLSSEIKHSHLSSHFSASMKNVKLERFDNLQGIYELKVTGTKSIYSKGKIIGNENLNYLLEIRRGAVTGSNPYGLYIGRQKINSSQIEDKNE